MMIDDIMHGACINNLHRIHEAKLTHLIGQLWT